VDGECPADETDRCGAGAKTVERLLARGDDTGLVGKTEIVIRRQDDDLAPSFHPHPGALRTVEKVEPLVGAVSYELFQLRRYPLLQGVGHWPTSRITFPAWPSLIT
jgi:hypothetical protein